MKIIFCLSVSPPFLSCWRWAAAAAVIACTNAGAWSAVHSCVALRQHSVMSVSCSDDKQDSVHRRFMRSPWIGPHWLPLGHTQAGSAAAAHSTRLLDHLERCLENAAPIFYISYFGLITRAWQANSHFVNIWHSASVIGGVSTFERGLYLSFKGWEFQFRKILKLGIELGLELECALSYRGLGWC